jgi:hypothetical protein
MKHQSISVLPAKLAEGCRHFEQWRSQHPTRRRLPNHLWALAAELAREYGVSKTARILQLDYNRLKQRSQRPVFKNDTPKAPAVQFLELTPDNANHPVQCIVECENEHRAKIRIQLKGPDWPDLAALCVRLWSPHR